MPPKSALSRPARAFTLVEVLSVLAIVALLLALLMPVVQSMREAARIVSCGNNQYQLGRGLQGYVTRFEKPPAWQGMLDKLGPFVEGQSVVYACPTAQAGRSATSAVGSYGVNMCLERFMKDSGKIVMADANEAQLRWTGAARDAWNAAVAPRHFGLVNVLMFDGSVQRMDPAALDPYDPVEGEDVRARLWRPERGCAGQGDLYPDCAEGGLIAEYWSDTAWARPKGGPPDLVRVDKTLAYPFGTAAGYTCNGPYPFPKMRYPQDLNGNSWPDCAFQGRWRGFVYAPCAGNYTMNVQHDDNCWVEIDGRQVFYRYCCGWANGSPFQLSSGWHAIEVRFDNDRWMHDYLVVQWFSDCFSGTQALDMSNLRCP